MTVTATGTFCLIDSASARSAIFLAVVSMSMVVCFLPESEIGRSDSALALEAQLSDIESESVLRVSGLLEPLLQERFDLLPCRWPVDGVHAGVPAGSDFDVGR